MDRILHLLPLALPSDDLPLLDWLGGAVARRLPVAPVLDPPVEIHPGWFVPGGDQLSSNHVVDALVRRSASAGHDPADWTLALTAADLRAPGRDFVFGEATLGGPCALLTLARLRDPEAPNDTDRLRARALKEAVHELGHLAGLRHCDGDRCVMRPSPGLEGIDAKQADFCPACRDSLDSGLDRGSDRR